MIFCAQYEWSTCNPWGHVSTHNSNANAFDTSTHRHTYLFLGIFSTKIGVKTKFCGFHFLVKFKDASNTTSFTSYHNLSINSKPTNSKLLKQASVWSLAQTRRDTLQCHRFDEPKQSTSMHKKRPKSAFDSWFGTQLVRMAILPQNTFLSAQLVDGDSPTTDSNTCFQSSTCVKFWK